MIVAYFFIVLYVNKLRGISTNYVIRVTVAKCTKNKKNKKRVARKADRANAQRIHGLQKAFEEVNKKKVLYMYVLHYV